MRAVLIVWMVHSTLFTVCCVTFSVNGGMVKSTGIMNVEISERFPGMSETAVLWIFMLTTIVNTGSGMFIPMRLFIIFSM